MTISVSRRLNIHLLVQCIMYKIIAFFIIKLTAQLYVRIGILLTCGKHLHGRIISLREGFCGGLAHKTSLALPPFFFIEVPVQSQKKERPYNCVLGVSILPISTILLLDFGNVPTV